MPRSSQGRASWASNDDHLLLSLAVIAFGLAFYGWLLWSNYHTEISAGVVRLAHWHIHVIRRFAAAHVALQSLSDYYADLDRRMLAADPARMTVSKLWEVAAVVGSPFRWPAAVLLAGLAVLCFFRSSAARFSRDFDLGSLMREHAKTFRTTAAFVERELGVVAPRAGEPRPADPALHPEEWIERYATADGAYDEAAARAELARQLGPVWQGIRSAAPHVRVLYAAFALHLVGRLPDTLALLGDMSEGLAAPEPGEGPGGPEQPLVLPATVVAIADGALLDPEVAGAAKAVVSRHGYTAPALMTLLNEARRRYGSLQPALFASLRLVDRRLWYALHSLGFASDTPGQDLHPNPYVEAVGARDHWAAELAAGGPLLVPALEGAVVAVRAAAGDAARVGKNQE